jgi:tetraacyldisaccharide 4'-kinase
LPEGRLREPLSSLRRAHAVVVEGDIDARSLPRSSAHIWKLRRGLSLSNPPKAPVVFCGIARPHAFLEQLRASGVHESATMFYRDHHRYCERDVRDLLQLKAKSGGGGFITTEKDAINLGPLFSQLGEVSIARVTMQLEQPNAAVDTLLRAIGDRKAQA